MEQIQEILNMTNIYATASQLSEREFEQRKCDRLNAQRKEPREGYECKLCGNKEGLYRIDETGHQSFTYCKCKTTRDNIRRLRKSGLQDVITKYALNKFIAAEDWQKNMLDKANEFLKNPDCGSWFFVSGQPGCGKTHICTGIVRELLYAGKDVRYLEWRGWVESLRAKMGKYDYEDFLNEYTHAEVLYIDDLFKDSNQPTKYEQQLAYMLINERYISPKLITIISCEYSPASLIKIDEAMGSRIWEMSKKFGLYIEPDKTKNYRTKDIPG